MTAQHKQNIVEKFINTHFARKESCRSLGHTYLLALFCKFIVNKKIK